MNESQGCSSAQQIATRELQVTVAQLGSRWHYLVPRVLAQQRMLARFVTDLWCPKVLARSRVAQTVLGTLGTRFEAALSRRDDDIPDQLVRHFPVFAWQYLRQKVKARRLRDIYQAYCWGGKHFCELASRVLPDNTSAVYAFTSAAQELFEAARARGMLCILDHASGFVTIEQELYNEQWRRYPDWGSPRETTDGLLGYAARQRRELELADLVLVPSSFAKDCLIRAGADPAKLTVLPLAFAANNGTLPVREPRSGPLRVLFAARQALLKGLPDLVEAFRLLPKDQFVGRVVGINRLPKAVQNQWPRNLELVGEVNRKDMVQQYNWADVFVFPTVCDTFGFVILEAMSFGLPVIATPNSAARDIIHHEENGFLIPVRSPECIASYLERLRADRHMLAEMSHNALICIRSYSEDSYRKRLTDYLNQLFTN